MRDVLQGLKTFVFMWLSAAVAGPLLLTEGLSRSIISGPYYESEPFFMPALALCPLMLVLGFLFARRARLSSVFYRRWLPVVLLPVAAMSVWAWWLSVGGGDYYAYSTLRTVVNALCLPTQTFMDALAHNYLRELPAFGISLGLLPEKFTVSADFYRLFFVEWSGIGAGLFFQLAWVLGFAGGDLLPQRTKIPQRTRTGWWAIVLLLLVSGGELWWQVNEQARTLIGHREEYDLVENFVGDENTVYHGPKDDPPPLIELDTPPGLRITEDFPRLDGATAFHPLYAAAFKAVYVPPPAAVDENDSARQERIRTFESRYLESNTSRRGYSRLIGNYADIFFGLEPSQEQLAEAQAKGVALRFIPLGLEAFVFIVNADNPVSSLTEAQIRDIYTRRIDNWKELGGSDAAILPFQRPESSGSQTIMLSAVMRGEAMTTPLREEVQEMMGDIITQVADYRNESAAIGYTFRWYAEEMYRVPNLKLLAVNGVAPTPGNIASGAYPYTVPFYAVVREGPLSPQTQALLDWFTGPEGQALIRKVGYVPLQPKDGEEAKK